MPCWADRIALYLQHLEEVCFGQEELIYCNVLSLFFADCQLQPLLTPVSYSDCINIAIFPFIVHMLFMLNPLCQFPFLFLESFPYLSMMQRTEILSLTQSVCPSRLPSPFYSNNMLLLSHAYHTIDFPRSNYFLFRRKKNQLFEVLELCCLFFSINQLVTQLYFYCLTSIQ